MEHKEQVNQPVFALDIGTRSVIGVVGYRDGDLFHVEAVERMEHPRRAMIDGQIEDIEQVARVAGQVKEKLEAATGRLLDTVAVAAAGRALKTCRASAKMDIPGGVVTPRVVFELENSAVNEAHRRIDEADGDGFPARKTDLTHYFCVGHSVVQYRIDGYPFTSILDHKGQVAEVEIIATFLPTEVVNSLRRCTELLGLSIETLTLEPIAAMRAVIPADVRLLNLGLVDIGAGTADIALSRDGTVSGYTMATVAGDEVTEAIIKQHLVDFETAERIKLELESGEDISYTDILGFTYTKPAKEILETIDLAVDMLAKVIADKMLETNGGPPTAVFLVGGGSRTPGLVAALSEKLGLEENRVAIAGTNFTERLVATDENGPDLNGPEYATPLGIGLVALDGAGSGGMAVEVNGRRVRLFVQERASIMDALLAAGYSYSDLMGRNGRSITFTLNGERRVARGGSYSAAEITVDGRPASLSTPVEDGGRIQVTPATSGEDASPVIADYAEGTGRFTVSLNGQPAEAGLLAFLNGTAAEPGQRIQEGDAVEISLVRTVGELCRSAGLSLAHTAALRRNGEAATADTLLSPEDKIETRGAEQAQDAASAQPVAFPADSVTLTGQNKAASENKTTGVRIEAASVEAEGDPAFSQSSFPPEDSARPHAVTNSKVLPFPTLDDAAAGNPPPVSVAAPPPPSEPGRPGGSLRIQLNGRTLVLPPKSGGPHQLLDLLPLLDIDPKHPQGRLLTQVGGTDAGYTTELLSGDQVEIRWEGD